LDNISPVVYIEILLVKQKRRRQKKLMKKRERGERNDVLSLSIVFFKIINIFKFK
jgi:hypothetical protein